MASSLKNVTIPKKLNKQYTPLLFPGIIKVAWQRFRRVWPLLSVIWLAMVVLVILICVEPLFIRVTTFAQMQDLIRNSNGGAAFTPVAASTHPTATQIEQAHAQIDQLVHTQLGTYAQGGNQVVLKTPDLQISSNQTGSIGVRSGAASGGPLQGTTGGAAFAISGYDNPAQLTGQLKIISGRLPATTGNQLEIAISQKTARDLGLKVGSQVNVRFPVASGSTVWQLNVVGIIELQPVAGDFWNTAYANGNNDAITTAQGYSGDSFDGVKQYDGTVEYNALASEQVLLPKAATISPSDQSSGFTLIWRYSFNLAGLDANTISSFLDHYSSFSNRLESGGASIPDLNSIWVPGSDLIIGLYGLKSRLITMQVISVILLCLTIALALLMTGTMSHVLVERQVATIAAMRSRGASRSHIFWAFATQGTLLALLAAAVGPLLAVLIVRLLTTHLLASADQSAADMFANNFSAAWLEVRWFALVATLLAFITMLIAVFRATKIDILTLRRESSRATQQPFWRRFYLDVILAFLICLGYGIFIYTLVSPLANNARVQTLQDLFSLIAVPLILIAVLLLFLRVLPWLLGRGTRVISRVGSTPSLLAFAQVERAPQAASRLILLLAITLASSIYLLSLISTQQQWYQTQANFQVGADFQGSLDATISNQSFAQLMQKYSTIHGVHSVTLGISQQSVDLGPTLQLPPLSFDAVDADTYANTALWSSDYSQQPLADLMQQLQTQRAEASAKDVVYALVDANMWQKLGLYPGAAFALSMPGYAAKQNMHFIALAEIKNIPGIYSSVNAPFSALGMLVDFQSYSTVYAKDNRGSTLGVNTVWLSTGSDPASLASVRRALPTFQDRRALIDEAQVQPDHVNILSILGLGVVVALVLGLLSTLVVSWVSLASRRTNFAALRALGMAPRQIVATLIWEQSIVYSIALLLGLGLGKLFAFNVVPTFLFISSLSYLQVSEISNVPPNVPPIHLSVPSLQIVLLIGILVVINGLGLVIMARIASRPPLDRVLRLNED